jgi:hypothetical protein
MQQADEFRTFSSACERLLPSIKTNRPLTEKEARILEFYCKEILAKIAQSLPNRPPQSTT